MSDYLRLRHVINIQTYLHFNRELESPLSLSRNAKDASYLRSLRLGLSNFPTELKSRQRAMALKRRNGEGGDEMTGREKKKLKVSTARTIAVQPTSNAVAGPSSSKAKDSTLSGSYTNDN